MTTDDTRRSDGQGLSEGEVELIREAYRRWLPHSYEGGVGIMQRTVERILAARGGNTDDGLRAAVLEAVRPTDSPMGTRTVLGSRDGSFVVDRVLAALDAAPAPTDNQHHNELAEQIAEAEIRGQMRHITAEMIRGDQSLGEQEDLIADLRARLSHIEAERDDLRRHTRDLADEWVAAEQAADDYGPRHAFTGYDCAEMLRAVVDGPTTPTQEPT